LGSFTFITPAYGVSRCLLKIRFPGVPRVILKFSKTKKKPSNVGKIV
jgi:hypothetical protein